MNSIDHSTRAYAKLRTVQEYDYDKWSKNFDERRRIVPALVTPAVSRQITM